MSRSMNAACLLAGIALQAWAHPPRERPQPAARPAPVARCWHLKVTGDLDSDRLVRDFGVELDRAAAAGVGLILLELDGNRWRPDAVRAMGECVRHSPVRTAAYLADPRDRTVGVGQAIIAMLAGECLIAPGTSIRGDAAADLRSLAPADVKWDGVEQDLADDLRMMLEPRGADPRLAELLVRPSTGAWWVTEPPGLETSAPSGAAVPFVVLGPRGPERTEIDADLAVALRVAVGQAPTLSRALTGLGVRSGAARQRSEVASALPAAEKRLERAIDDLRVELERIEETLRVTPMKLDRRPQAHDFRRAGDEALKLVVRADAALAAAVTLTEEFPELLRDRPATPPAARSRVLGGFRVKLDEHRATAEEYRTRR